MSFIQRWFGSGKNKLEQPNISFGRYSDAYKETEQYESWDESLAKFDKEKYLEAYKAFFVYLRDDKEENVKWWEEKDGLRFEIYQGSRKIVGFANDYKVRVEAKIARASKLKRDFLRRLMEHNYNLRYSRFALDHDNNITITFDSFVLDGSPYKLYYAIKELAINADKQDDLLLDEFGMLEPIETGHLSELPEVEKHTKYNFIIKEIQKTFDCIDHGKLDTERYPGAVAYLLLHLSYKLDYLVKPEGYLMESLERIHRLYFAKKKEGTKEKNEVLRQELQKLIERPRADYFKEMYRVTATFGITTPVNHDRLAGFINGELGNMNWYLEEAYEEIALAVPGYIVGYCLFNYAVPKPDKAYLHFFYQVTEAAYFRDLGFRPSYYDAEKQVFNQKAIRRRVFEIAEENKLRFPHLNPNFGHLNFSSMSMFGKSYLEMIQMLNLTRID